MFSTISRWLGLVVLLVPGTLASAQQIQEPLTLAVRIQLRSAILGETRSLWISTPEGYDSSGARFPVLYVLDPDIHFRHANALARFSSHYLRSPRMIVVGVPSTNRSRDFTPAPAAGEGEEAAPRSGGADGFLRFLTEEVQSYVNREYRTERFSILVGHSLGGLFAVHALAKNPDAFDAHIAISPSLYWNDSATLAATRRTLDPATRRSGFLYLALGERERPAIATSTRALAAALEDGAPASFAWSFQEFPGENHITVPYPALHAALRWLFRGWGIFPDGTAAQIAEAGSLAPFDEHFAAQSERYGYPVRPPELAMRMIGARLLDQGNLDEAVELLGRRVSLYPRSPLAHDALAGAYDAKGEPSLALESRERAYALAAAQEHPSLEAIQERLEKARNEGGPKQP